ncbi:unnamed protein product [Didymodactylos carnosus]|uniref:Uncharacterized protein n=1 Tax=Didymodactylos carnosus TaxID=1234261 RepID=A0A816CY17_9BILA|nr:unnamed protein product [Didymodactylos carnosus]CAF1627626.1 unnamed protein product [Didymodactylos carnosus]CAF4420734.1 unnamed protein product [Didymodactylos carnosus]CAF4523226.1 unnamed protein product [Didymodactylos carnosus]
MSFAVMSLYRFFIFQHLHPPIEYDDDEDIYDQNYQVQQSIYSSPQKTSTKRTGPPKSQPAPPKFRRRIVAKEPTSLWRSPVRDNRTSSPRRYYYVNQHRQMIPTDAPPPPTGRIYYQQEKPRRLEPAQYEEQQPTRYVQRRPPQATMRPTVQEPMHRQHYQHPAQQYSSAPMLQPHIQQQHPPPPTIQPHIRQRQQHSPPPPAQSTTKSIAQQPTSPSRTHRQISPRYRNGNIEQPHPHNKLKHPELYYIKSRQYDNNYHPPLIRHESYDLLPKPSDQYNYNHQEPAISKLVYKKLPQANNNNEEHYS